MALSGFLRLTLQLYMTLSGSLWLALLLYLFLSVSLCLPLALSGSLSGSLWLSRAISGSLSGSLWLAVRPSLACCLALSGLLSGSLWLPCARSCSLRLFLLALYCSPNLLTKSSLGSQEPCSARSSAAALLDFLQVGLDKPAHLTIRVLWVLVSDCETSAATL